jgi:hypothetical protein
VDNNKTFPFAPSLPFFGGLALPLESSERGVIMGAT